MVSYAIVSVTTGNLVWAFVRHLARLAAWNIAPNGKKAVFYNIWGGHHARPGRFRAQQRADLAAVLVLLP